MKYTTILKVDTDSVEAPVKGVGCGALVRALHRWITRIGWTDLGTAFALYVLGQMSLADGHAWRGIFCFMIGVTVYVRAPRPNTAVSNEAGNET